MRKDLDMIDLISGAILKELKRNMLGIEGCGSRIFVSESGSDFLIET
jgi:hypothetical protein